MQTWDYIVGFNKLRSLNNIAVFEEKAMVHVNDEIIEKDCMYLKDKINNKWVQVIFFKDRFLNTGYWDELPVEYKLYDLTQHLVERLIGSVE